MIHVIAAINVKSARFQEFTAIFKANVPAVLAEDGCVRYEPTVDVPTGLPPQIPHRPATLTVVEAWASVEHLNRHLQAPHMLAYKEKVKDMVEGVSIQVLGAA